MLIFTYHTKKNQPRKDCQNHIIGEQKLATYPKAQIHQK